MKNVCDSVVPWYNSDEWKNVYKLLFESSATHDYQAAMDILVMWQIRNPILPSGVEGTLCILEALLVNNNEVSERQYQILCASSIMRFLNICVASRAGLMNFTQTARDNRIPEWIISIRHDFAHSQKLPNTSLLKLALKECFRWLENTYWKPELKTICDNIINVSNTANMTLSMNELLGLYCSIFVYDVKNLCYDEFIQNKLELVDAHSQINEYPKVIMTLLEKGAEDYSNFNWLKCFTDIMFTNWFTINPNDLLNKRGECNKQYDLINELMNFMEQHAQISKMILELLYLTDDNSEPETRRIGAAKWLNEILKGMLKYQEGDSNVLKNTPGIGIEFRHLKEDTIKHLRHFQMQIQSINENYRKHFQRSYFLLLDRNADITVIIKELNQKAVNSINLEQSLEDFKSYMESVQHDLPDECDEIMVENEKEPEESTENHRLKKRWSLVKDASNFETCPLGILPSDWN